MAGREVEQGREGEHDDRGAERGEAHDRPAGRIRATGCRSARRTTARVVGSAAWSTSVMGAASAASSGTAMPRRMCWRVWATNESPSWRRDAGLRRHDAADDCADRPRRSGPPASVDVDGAARPRCRQHSDEQRGSRVEAPNRGRGRRPRAGRSTQARDAGTQTCARRDPGLRTQGPRLAHAGTRAVSAWSRTNDRERCCGRRRTHEEPAQPGRAPSGPSALAVGVVVWLASELMFFAGLFAAVVLAAERERDLAARRRPPRHRPHRSGHRRARRVQLHHAWRRGRRRAG